MGFLSGPDFPRTDPTDLGALVPLPGGWKELFEFLAGLGIKQSSSRATARTQPTPAGRRQPAPGVPTPEVVSAYLDYARRLRGLLDEFGLEAIGNHGFIPNTWPGRTARPARAR